ncbi:MAG: isochorismate synthase [Micrococcales bacterium]|nr:isochorismate synthase [Micrococcales bacterium]
MLEQLPGGVPARDLCTWVRDGEGLVGWGRAAAVTTSGTQRFADAQNWWHRNVQQADVEDEVELAGTGPIVFGSFSYSPYSPAGASLVVPRIVLGHRDGTWWRTTVETVEQVDEAPENAAQPSLPPPTDLSYRFAPVEPVSASRPRGQITFTDGALSGEQWRAVVAQAVRRIGDGQVDKVVLARDLLGHAEEPIDPRLLTSRLASGYGRTWVFCVDGLVGATPEMLVRLERGLVTSRVLAGTIRRTGDDEHDLALAASLARSSKDLEEHEYAVRSVAEALAEHCTSINVPESPFVLHLPNVMHLATDVAGRTRNGGTSLALAASLHPSAAVCGTPTATADDLIEELEGMDRGRYAGPVGWMGASGDGEWGIALRCGALDPADARRIRLFAGCGIVAGSDPHAELAESEAKLVPMRGSLTG